MIRYRFGDQEEVTCLAPALFPGPEGESLCVAYKTTTVNFFGPVYIRDDGYVLGVQGRNDYYPLPQGANLTTFQASGGLPDPLPTYHLSFGEYVEGCLLSLALAGLLALSVLGALLKRRRHASLGTPTPPEIGAPRLSTKTDRWLAQEAQKLIEGDEVVQQQAYGTNADLADANVSKLHGLYLVLTDRCLLVIRCRIGAFGPLRENDGVRSIARTAILRVEHDERRLRFLLTNGEALEFYAQWSERHLSNQRRFLRDVPRLLGVQQMQSA